MSTLVTTPVAARPSVAVRTVVAGLAYYVAQGLRAMANRRQAARLSDLDDALLADIGLSRAELDKVLSRSRFAVDPTSELARIAHARASIAI